MTPCVDWPGAVTREGYGTVANGKGGSRPAHRMVYERERGPIPAGLTIDHLCRNRRCVNPEHMEPVTNRENVLRGIGPSAIHARATRCPQGHPYDEENTIRRPSGRRGCRACHVASDRSRRLCDTCGQSISRAAFARHQRRESVA